MAAQFCSRCGHELASTTQFCPSCGAPVGVSGGSVTKVEAAAGSTRRLLLPLAIAALLVLVVAVAVLAGRLHQQSLLASRSQPIAPAPSLLSAPSVPQAAPAITNAPSVPVAPAPAITNSASKPAPQLPPEDAQYLKFLEGIEQRRIALNNDTAGAAAMQDATRKLQESQSDPDQQQGNLNQGFSKLDQGYTGYETKYQILTRDFRAVSPPPDCEQLANKYFAALADYSDILSKTEIILSNVKPGSTPDLGALMKEQAVLQEAQTKVNADFSSADREIASLCDHYGVPKPFSIQVEGASSPITGL